jgi:23S rRNA (cytosine1962-C5)-methyltransferase
VRTLNLSKSGLNKILSRQFELKSSDFEDSINPVPPGEWCCIKISEIEHGLVFINSMVGENYTCAYMVEKLRKEDLVGLNVEKFILKRIEDSVLKRKRFKDYEKNARLFYGASDGLPGLIIDLFRNASIIQINTAGIDRYREQIKTLIENLTKLPAYYLDNPKYREKESLPFFENPNLPELIISENDINYKIRSEVLQKVGFYYDHRENRFQLMSLLSRMNLEFKSGVDLFCYVGAWGVSALKSGLQHCDFVDQGDFSIELEQSLTLNDLEKKGQFHRMDVFKYLDEEIKRQTKFDLILSDPPAFAKSAVQKTQALEGYTKLHRKVMKVAASGALVAFSSCTQYVSHEEFQKNIQDAARKENRMLQLLYAGIQGFDHPMSSQNERSNYIKSYFYIVE